MEISDHKKVNNSKNSIEFIFIYELKWDAVKF